MDTRTRLNLAFQSDFGAPPTWIVRAPGRVNLIGEHTDYNLGFVLPAAIDRFVYISLRTRTDRRVILRSLEREEILSIDLNSLAHAGPAWGEYARGVAWALQEHGLSLRGWEGILTGEVPIGAGLSSSAALELALARAFAAAGDLPWDSVQMARWAQAAENRWVGVQSGLMDQLTAACGRAGHALLIDCRSLELSYVRLPDEVQIVILDTSTRRDLKDTSYNLRRQECDAAAKALRVGSLREVDIATLEAAQERLGGTLFRRARHVITENVRTLAAAQLLASGEFSRVGHLLYSSHESLRHDFEVSSPALDAAVECTAELPGCYGARLTGGGFAGAAMALVERSRAVRFSEDFRACFVQATGLSPAVYRCSAVGGAEVVSGPDKEPHLPLAN